MTNGDSLENLLPLKSAADRSAKGSRFDRMLGDAGQFHSIGQTTLARNVKGQGGLPEADTAHFLAKRAAFQEPGRRLQAYFGRAR
jgi:hypothetical protein